MLSFIGWEGVSTSPAAGVRLLDGSGRRLAAASFVAVVVVFAFSGKYLLVPLAVAVTAIAFSGVPRGLMTWFAEHDAATLLRWVRRVELAFVPFALVLAGLLLATGSAMWWIGCASAGLGLLAAAPMGAAIGRAEARAEHDPDAWREWARRAERLTAVAFAGVAALAVGLAFALGGAGLAIMLAAMFATASGAASAVRRRAG